MSVRRTNPRRPRPRAFTLVEMVTSIAILSLLMVALGYGLKLALVSTGNGAASAASSLEGVELVNRMMDDLAEAMNFTEKGTASVTFTVPDRGADGNPDSIRYAWWPTGGTVIIPGSGGGSGDTTITIPAKTLTRQVNNGAVSTLARDVGAFDLGYLYRSMSPPPPAGPSERLLWSCDPVAGVAQDGLIDLNRWIAETFTPANQLPAGTTSWAITRVALYTKADASLDGVIRVSIRGVNVFNNTPNVIIHQSALASEVSFSDSYAWYDFTFATPATLSPSTKYALVIEGTAGQTGTYWGTAGYVQSGIPIPSGTWLAVTTNRGTSWSTTTSSSLRYKIYGTTTP